MRRTPSAALLAGIAACAFLPFAPARADGQKNEMTGDFEWFTSLAWGDVKDLKPVSCISFWYSTGGGPQNPFWLAGFLVKDSPDEFTVQHFDFTREAFSKHPAHPANSQDARFEPVDLAACAQDALDRWKDPAAPPRKITAALPGFELAFGGPVYSDRARLFVLAWTCSRQGLDKESAALYTAAQAARGINSTPGSAKAPDEKDWPFRWKLERDLGQFDFWRVLLDLRDPAIPRVELAKHLRSLATEFPHYEDLARVNALADTLESMAAGDKAHTWLTPGEIAKLSPDEQAKEWVFRLRDHAESRLPPVAIPHDEMPASSSLLALGDAAVPRLIDALGDTHPTRTLHVWNESIFSHKPETVGEIAWSLLEQIAGHPLVTPASLRDADPAAQARGAAEEWWKTRREKGVQGELAAFTASGGPYSAEAGQTLLNKYPDAAFPPLLAGAQAAADRTEHEKFIGLLSSTGDPRVKPFLLKTAQESADLAVRAEAARDLTLLGDTSGIAPLAVAWLQSRPAPEGDPDNQRTAAIYVLANSDSPAGYEALANGLRSRSITAQRYILDNLSSASGQYSMQLSNYRTPSPFVPPPPLSAPAQEALDALLAGELDYATPPDGGGIADTHGPSLLFNTCVGQAAAAALARIHPGQYQFDPAAPWAACDRQRIISLNTWRKSKNLPALPVPPEPTVVKQEDASHVVLIVRDPSVPPLPKAVQKAIDAAQGRKLDSALLRSIVDAVQASAKAGSPPAAPFSIEASRSPHSPGLTLLILPAPDIIPPAAPSHPQESTWEAALSMSDGQAGYSGGIDGIARYIDAIAPSGQFALKLDFSPPGSGHPSPSI